METIKTHLPWLLGMLMQVFWCNAQSIQEQKSKTDRLPAVAGAFYPANKTSLIKQLESYFNNAHSGSGQTPLAIIVPHAGYIYSANVAVAAFKQINRNAQFKHIFIIGSSHTSYFNGSSVYYQGDFITPLGKVPVDTLAGWLDREYSFINGDPQPHQKEHSIEVELPLLQYWLTKPFSIVPIIMGGESPENSNQLATALAPFFTPDNLFIISTDFSHYPNHQNAVRSDSLVANAIISNSPQEFLRVKTENEKNIPNLITALCGWTSVLTLLDITHNLPDITFRKILHKTSGNASFSDYNRVVGYNAIAVYQIPKSEDFQLTSNDKQTLLSLARKTISEYLTTKNIAHVNLQNFSASLKTPAGAFVTLTENGELRGCIGNFAPSQPLYSTVQSMAIASATRDTRFNPISLPEISHVKIEISVLTPMHKIASIDEIVLGKHGIYIKKGSQTGTFLPQVATETKWTKEEFLGHCARDKASIGWDGWKDADIYVYEALVFGE